MNKAISQFYTTNTILPSAYFPLIQGEPLDNYKINLNDLKAAILAAVSADDIAQGTVNLFVTSGQTLNWDTAYGWGNHADAGYLTSYTETDPVFTLSPAGSITATDIINWGTAYGWGNHADAGYLTSETDPVFNAWLSTDPLAPYVPYTGATQDVDLGTYGLTSTTLSLHGLDKAGNPITVPMTFSQANGTIDVAFPDGVTGQMFQELWLEGKCQGNVRNGYPAQYVGSQGDHILVKEAVMSEINEFPESLIGIFTHNQINGSFVKITWFGNVNDVNTTDWEAQSANKILYLDTPETGYKGLTTIEPSVPHRKIKVATIIRYSTGGADNGRIMVRPTFGVRLTDLDDVNGTPLTESGQLLVWDQTNGYFDFTANINDKQDNLVSGVNIKTVNGQSIVGSGDLQNYEITKKFIFSENITAGNVVQLIENEMVEKVKVEANNSLTLSADQQIYVDGYSFDYLSAKINPFNQNRVMITYHRSGSIYPTLKYYAINGDTLTELDTVSISAYKTTDINIDFDPFNENKFIVVYGETIDGNYYNLKAKIGTITNDDITFAAEHTLVSLNQSAFGKVVVEFSKTQQNKAFISYGSITVAKDYIDTLIISGTTITSPYTPVLVNSDANYIYSLEVSNISNLILLNIRNANQFIMYTVPTNGQVVYGNQYNGFATFDNFNSNRLFITNVSTKKVYTATFTGTTITSYSSEANLNGVVISAEIYSDENIENEFIVKYRVADGTNAYDKLTYGRIDYNNIIFGYDQILGTGPAVGPGMNLFVSFDDLFGNNRFIYLHSLEPYDPLYATFGTITYNSFTNLDSSKIIGLAFENGLQGEQKYVRVLGSIGSGQTGLVQDSIYYVNYAGVLTTELQTLSINNAIVGRAISTTEILIYNGNGTFELSPASSITSTNITNWNTAYGWGNHATAGYLTTETDPVFLASAAAGITSGDISTWNAKQDALVSGTNIKTVNGDSIVGSGDLTINKLYQPDGTNAFVYTDNAGALHIDGNIIQNGSTYETHAEQIYTKDNYIILREGAIAGLSTGEYAGFEAVKYDGTNNGRLVFDNTGTARVGDIGFEQPLATREETPTNGGFAVWNAATYKFITTGYTTTDAANWNTAYGWGDHSTAGYLTSYTETDPVFLASAAAGIIGTDITNWDTAYGWGNHALAGYLTSYTETDPVFLASAAAGIIGTDITNWDTAYGWGNHALAGYLTSYTETDPVFLASVAAGITNTDITNWNTAYGWGNHALAGYLTSYTETDPVFIASEAYNITSGDTASWDAKQEALVSGTNIKTINGISILGSGNLEISGTGSETDPIFVASPAYNITSGDIINWNTAYGWGDHALAGYLTSYTETDPVFVASEAYTITSGDTASWDAKQEALVSGTNIKTINNESILGSGNITITGGSGSSVWTALDGTRTGNNTFTISTDVTALIAKGVIVKWTESSVVKVGMVISSSYSAPNTTVTIVGDTITSIDASSLKYCMIGAEVFVKNFVAAGSLGTIASSITNIFIAMEPFRVLGADLYVGTAGTTNNTTIDINNNGTTMFTTKPTLASGVSYSSTTFGADNEAALALGNKVTIDIDAVQSTSAVDLYVNLYIFPTRYLNLV